MCDPNIISHADAHRDGIAHFHGNTHAHAYCYPDAIAHTHPDADADEYKYADGNPDHPAGSGNTFPVADHDAKYAAD